MGRVRYSYSYGELFLVVMFGVEIKIRRESGCRWDGVLWNRVLVLVGGEKYR